MYKYTIMLKQNQQEVDPLQSRYTTRAHCQRLSLQMPEAQEPPPCLHTSGQEEQWNVTNVLEI